MPAAPYFGYGLRVAARGHRITAWSKALSRPQERDPSPTPDRNRPIQPWLDLPLRSAGAAATACFGAAIRTIAFIPGRIVQRHRAIVGGAGINIRPSQSA